VAKITEIQIDDKNIKITDTFTSVMRYQNYIDGQASTKIGLPIGPVRNGPIRRNILDKRSKGLITNDEGQEEFRMRDTKNVVKNIFRLFHTWVEDHSPS